MKADNYKAYMYDFIDRVVTETGPRVSCSESEKKAGRMMAEEMGPVCDQVNFEPFTCNPTAFLGFFPIIVGLYMVSMIFYWLWPIAAVFLMGAALLIYVLESVLYKEFIDRFFKKGESENIVGIIKPKGDVKKRVIVSGHLDSAYEFNLWFLFKNAAIPIMIVTVFAFLYLFIISTIRSVAMFSPIGGADLFNTLGIIALCLAPFVTLFIFFHTYSPVPGAMDDMAGVAVTAGLGKYLDDARDDGNFFPKNTEIVLIGMGCEEAGLRGAKRYARDHIEDSTSIPTYALFLDGIYDEKYLTVINQEVGTRATHDPRLVKLAQDVASENKFSIKRGSIPIGASDASAFSLAGIPSTCLLCQDSSKLVPNYHTRYDTIDHIRPESLAVMLQMVVGMIEHIDQENNWA